MSEALTPALILLPMGSALLLACLCGRIAAARGVAALLVSAQVLLVTVIYLAFDGPRLVLQAAWLPALGSQLLLSIDGLSMQALLLLTAILVVAVVAEIRLQEGGPSGARLVLIFVAITAMNLFVLSGDLLLSAAAYGTAGLALAALLGIGADMGGQTAARSFASWTVVGALLLSAAAAILAAGTGSTVIDDLTHITPDSARVAALLMVTALAMQVPLVPLHTWLAPIATAGTLAGRTLIFGGWCMLGAFGLLRYGLGLFPDLLSYAAPLPLLWGTATVVYAAIVAIAQQEQDLARRLSWATVGAGGLLLAGVAGLESLPVLGAWLHATVQGVPRVGLLLLAHWMATSGARRGSLAILWALLALCLGAIPGAILFPGWLLVVAGTPDMIVAGLLLVASAMLVFALVAPATHIARGSVGPPLPVALSRVLAVATIVVLLAGFYPQPLVNGARPVVERLLTRTAAADLAP